MQMKRNRKRRTLSAVKKKRKTQRNIRLGFLILGIVLVVMLIIKINNPGFFFNKYYEVDTKAVDASEPDIDVELLTPNPYSRSQEKTDKITGIVIHYTANPGATAIGNRNYFEGLKDSHETKASSNFVVGLKGRSCSVFRPGKWRMHRMTGIMIQYPSNVAIRMRLESLTMRLIVLWSN